MPTVAVAGSIWGVTAARDAEGTEVAVATGGAGVARLRALSGKPLVVSPMAGGPSTVELVVAASKAGAFAFLAGGYKKSEDLQSEMAAVRAAGVDAFGVNLFVPGAPTDEPARLDAYLTSLRPLAHSLGSELGAGEWDDDDYPAKLDGGARQPAVRGEFHVRPARPPGRSRVAACGLARHGDRDHAGGGRCRLAGGARRALPPRRGGWKTRLIRFQPPEAAGSATATADPTAPQTFDFRGFTHYWGRSRKGGWVVSRKTAKGRLKRAPDCAIGLVR